MRSHRWLLALVVGAAVSIAGMVLASTLPNSIVWDGQGFEFGEDDCDKLGESPERTEDGWMHWLVTQGGGIDEAELVLSGSGTGTYDPTKYGPVVEFFTPYFDGSTLVATLFYDGTLGGNSQFTLSDYCPGRSLEVEKTAFTEFTRTHEWDIDKSVEGETELDGTPKIWLYGPNDPVNASGTATWTVDVSYEGFVDGGFAVYGEITITSIAVSPKTIDEVVDDLGFAGYDDIDLDCGVGFPYVIAPGEVLDCTYRVEFADGEVEEGDFGTNTVTVYVENEAEPYEAEADWSFDAPTTEDYECVTITDDNPGFHEKYPAPVTVCAPDGDTFTYEETFEWVDYPDLCGQGFAVENTAEIVQTEQSADALLKINVRCEDLEVSKTVVTYFEREHFWDIDKSVEGETELDGTPKIWLYGPNDPVNASGTATWTVGVTYEGDEDFGFNVSGAITIVNTGTLDAVITGIVDELAGTEIDIDCGEDFEFGDILAVGETLVCTYSEDGYVEGFNEVTVTTERASYGPVSEPIVWGDPDEEINECVTITDDNPGFHEKYPAPVTVCAPDGDTFTYEETFEWVDYPDLCGQGFAVENTAEIVQTEQSADALLKINVRCEDLEVSKTVVTYFEREHFWDIDKKVDTEKGYTVDEDIAKVWLYIDGSGNEMATWTVDVTYEGDEDFGFNVSGAITIVNTGTLDAVITGIVDELAGTEIDIDCGEDFEFGDILAVGETLVCTYSEDGYVEGFNEVTVTTERASYGPVSEPIVWGEPDKEINKTVNIQDISNLFGTKDLGSVTAPDGDTFTYDKDFEYPGEEGCGSFQYDNTAAIVETEQSASATLKVNVQCFIYDSAWAKGDPNVPFCDYFSNWGWTNPIDEGTYEWPLWAGAAQCDTGKGTLVGTVEVVYGAGGNVDVTFNVDEEYDLEETHVYAGEDMFPQQRRGRQTVDTVAPGQYYNDSPFERVDDELPSVYVIAHAVVGYPDPNFGP